MFLLLKNVQKDEAVLLQKYFDNRDGLVKVGLQSITYMVEWHNIINKNRFFWRPDGLPPRMVNIPAGLYSSSDLLATIRADK